jgi:hypothetical protein
MPIWKAQCPRCPPIVHGFDGVCLNLATQVLSYECHHHLVAATFDSKFEGSERVGLTGGGVAPGNVINYRSIAVANRGAARGQIVGMMDALWQGRIWAATFAGPFPSLAARSSARRYTSERATNWSRRSSTRPASARALSALAGRHADDGNATEGKTFLATMQILGTVPSFSPPRVSEDSRFSDAPFRTLKYRRTTRLALVSLDAGPVLG